MDNNISFCIVAYNYQYKSYEDFVRADGPTGKHFFKSIEDAIAYCRQHQTGGYIDIVEHYIDKRKTTSYRSAVAA